MRRRVLRVAWCTAVLLLAALGCKPRVLVVGLDGASWKIIDPLMAAGYLPTMEALTRTGARADLDCTPADPVHSCFCPPVWQSIFTGQPARVHGIFNFPQLSGSRRAATLWDLTRAFGGESTLFDLHNIWPPDRSADVVLSEPGGEILAGVRYQIANPVVSGDAFDAPYTWTKPSNLFELLGLDEVPQGGPTWKTMAMDRVSVEMLARVAGAKRDRAWWERRPELDVILLHSPDRSMHMTWPTIQLHPGDPIDVPLLLAIAAKWTGPFYGPPPYQWDSVASPLLEADRHIATLLASQQYDYVVLLSDHGMATNPEQAFPPGIHSVPESFRGIFLLWSPGIVRSGVDLGRLSVLDVAPTLAYVLGIPLADDLPGRFVAEAFEPIVLQAVPPGRIASWQPYLLLH